MDKFQEMSDFFCIGQVTPALCPFALSSKVPSKLSGPKKSVRHPVPLNRGPTNPDGFYTFNVFYFCFVLGYMVFFLSVSIVVLTGVPVSSI